jgi:predicted signal transduction protein with EAL and GGDEF domain
MDCIAVTVTASIGIALYPSHADNAVTLMQRAERALIQAKIRGRDCFYPGGATCSGGTVPPPRTARW